jgi:hypothetical protein
MQGNRSDSGILAGTGPLQGTGAPRRLRRRALIGALGLAFGLLALLGGAAASAASPYPPNTVVSTYVDPRYCNGLVSVVTDSGGNLINVCATTGQRIYPVFADYGYWGGYVAPTYVNGYYGYYSQPAYVNGSYPYLGSYPYYGYTGIYSGSYTVVAPNGTPYVLGPPYRVK